MEGTGQKRSLNDPISQRKTNNLNKQTCVDWVYHSRSGCAGRHCYCYLCRHIPWFLLLLYLHWHLAFLLSYKYSKFSLIWGHFLLLFYFFGILASYFWVPPAGSPLLPRLSSSILPAHIFLHFQLLLSSSPMLLLLASVALFTPFSRASSVELVTIRNPSR